MTLVSTMPISPPTAGYAARAVPCRRGRVRRLIQEREPEAGEIDNLENRVAALLCKAVDPAGDGFGLPPGPGTPDNDRDAGRACVLPFFALATTRTGHDPGRAPPLRGHHVAIEIGEVPLRGHLVLSWLPAGVRWSIAASARKGPGEERGARLRR